MADPRRERVRSRYDDLLGLFELQWRDHGHQSVHFGYYDEDHDDPGAAMTNTTRKLAEVGNVDGSDLVLDLGCGAGGDAVWLASERGARVVGVDLVAAQLQRAHRRAVEAGIEQRTAFEQGDFHELSIAEAGAIDVAWALESLSHSLDLTAVAEGVYDVLTDDGRFVVADVFLEDVTVADAHEETLASIESSMGLEFRPINEFDAALEAAGFRDVKRRDVTPAIMPGADRSLDTSTLLGPLAKVGSSLGIATDAVGEYVAFWSDVHELLAADCAGYYFVRATKGDAVD